MPNPPPNQPRFSHLRRIEQISENHCGPAVIPMLLENIGISVTQEAITDAAGARLCHKEKAKLDDLEFVLDECKYPVGGEWQGLFDDDVDEFSDDYGHY